MRNRNGTGVRCRSSLFLIQFDIRIFCTDYTHLLRIHYLVQITTPIGGGGSGCSTWYYVVVRRRNLEATNGPLRLFSPCKSSAFVLVCKVLKLTDACQAAEPP